MSGKGRGISQEVHKNDEDSFTRKKTCIGRAGAPLYGEQQNSEQSFTPQETPENEFEREKSFKQFQAVLLLIDDRNTPQPLTTLLQQVWLTPQ